MARPLRRERELEREREQEREREIFCSTIFYTNALPLKRERELEREREPKRVHKTLALAFPLARVGFEVEVNKFIYETHLD